MLLITEVTLLQVEKQTNRFLRSVCGEPQLLTTLHSVATTKQHLVNWTASSIMVLVRKAEPLNGPEGRGRVGGRERERDQLTERERERSKVFTFCT